MRKKILRCGLIACLLACLAGQPRHAYADDNKEALVQAAFIYNFVKFVEWPGEKAISKQLRIDICVIGDSGMANAGEVFKAASTAKLALTLVQEKNARSAAAHCHVVFIGKSEGGRIGDALAALKGHPVLTVSDADGFVEAGGMIGFVNSDNKVKIEVNKRPVTEAGMRVDAQLLEIALQVIDK